jgi:alpha,alpha-trehalase
VPVDHSAERVLLRTARCLQGTVDFVLECEPAFDYGRQRGAWRHTGSGYGQAEVSAGEEGPPLRLTTDLNVGFEGPRAIARRRLRAGERVFCALSWDDGLRRRPSPTLISGWRARRISGMSGSAGGTSPITRGARCCSGRR